MNGQERGKKEIQKILDDVEIEGDDLFGTTMSGREIVEHILNDVIITDENEEMLK